MNENFEIESNHLLYVQKEYDEIIDDTNLKIKNLSNFYQNNYDKLLEEKERLLSSIDVLNRSKLKPYFARIDFQNNNDKKIDVCYIGKIGVMNYDNEIITVDWRAPVASLYYDYNIGEASYLAPEGKIDGNLLVKRQYEIENGKLLSFNDVDTVSNDDLLKPYLGTSVDNRLKNIVATIQSEQNKIIRQDLKNNLIIQGVAGSGKTTVALHRIAYLVYNNRNLYKASQYMVIGPNKFFVNYISSILPDLDVNGVAQYDLIELAQNYLNEKLQIKNSLDVLSNVVNGYKDIFANYVTSMDFKNQIDNYFKEYSNNLIPDNDLIFKNFKILDFDTIKEVYLSINDKTHRNLKAKIDKTISLLSKIIDEKKESILEKSLSNVLSKNITEINQSKEIKNRELLKKELNISGNKILKQYFKKVSKDIFQIYYEIIMKDSYLKHNGFNRENKGKQILKKNISVEDLTPLMYINYKIYGSKDFANYKHVVIDEAQDYNVFTFYVLKRLMQNSTFSIYGDLAQSLYSYKSIKNWKEIINPVFNGNCDIMYLEKSYRTTIEIMNEANKINSLLNYPLAVPVIRHGLNVNYIDFFNKDLKSLIMKKINELKGEKFKSIAIISKTQSQTDSIFDNLNDKVMLKKVTSEDLEFDSGVCCIPSYLAKGLEFDAVIIIDSLNDPFNPNNDMDMKLLYVSMTRALHSLNFFYEKELVNVLK